MTITTIVENMTVRNGIDASHGLSMMIGIGGKIVLFDTGPGDILLKNAAALSLELRDVDAVVLSHGHYDHAGGLPFLLEVNSRASVFTKSGIFTPKYKTGGKFIGVKPTDGIQKRIRSVDTVTEIVRGLYVITDIPLAHPGDTHFDHMLTVNGGKEEPDTFADELCAVAVENGTLTLFTGCAHRGVTNMTEAVLRNFGRYPDRVIGGFHMRGCADKDVNAVMDTLEKQLIKEMGVCHCTGAEAYAAFRQRFGKGVFYNHAGCVIKTDQ